MKFKFPFKTLLKQREITLQEAKREFFEAQSTVDETNGEINEYWQSIDQSRAEVSKLQQSPSASMEFLASFDGYILGQQIKIERTKNRLREEMLILEERREQLVEAGREKKILERLKEKMYEKFKKQKIKKERKQVDEIVTMSFKRGRHGQSL